MPRDYPTAGGRQRRLNSVRKSARQQVLWVPPSYPLEHRTTRQNDDGHHRGRNAERHLRVRSTCRATGHVEPGVRTLASVSSR